MNFLAVRAWHNDRTKSDCTKSDIDIWTIYSDGIYLASEALLSEMKNCFQV